MPDFIVKMSQLFFALDGLITGASALGPVRHEPLNGFVVFSELVQSFEERVRVLGRPELSSDFRRGLGHRGVVRVCDGKIKRETTTRKLYIIITYEPSFEQLGPGDVDDGVMRNFFDTLALVLNITPFTETTAGASDVSCGSSTGLTASIARLCCTEQQRGGGQRRNTCCCWR